MELKDQIPGTSTHWNPWAKLSEAKMEWPDLVRQLTYVVDSILKVQKIYSNLSAKSSTAVGLPPPKNVTSRSVAGQQRPNSRHIL